MLTHESSLNAAPSSRRPKRFLLAGLFFAALLAGAAMTFNSAFAAQGDCAQPVSNGETPLAGDCLFILRASVDIETCDPECICDVDGSGAVFASDALICLQASVGIDVDLDCQCGPTTTTTTSSTSTSSSSSSSSTSSSSTSSTTTITSTTTSTSTSTTTSTVTMPTTTTTLPLSQPALSGGDFPSVAPCAARDTLASDATFQATVQAAAGYYLTVNFSQYDLDGFPEICGISDVDNSLDMSNVEWDPSRDNVLSGCQLFTDDATDFFTDTPSGHGPELCTRGNFMNFFVADAFPRAGVFRKDGCVDAGATESAYDVRTRLTVSGSSTDQTFESLGVTRADLVFCNEGVEVVTQAASKNLLTSSNGNATLEVRSTNCQGTLHATVQAEIICITKRDAACPPADFGPSGCSPS